MKNSLSYKVAITYIWSLVKKHSRSFFLYVFVVALSASIQAILPFVARLETDQLVQKDIQLWGIQLSSAFFVFLVIAGVVALVSIVDAVLGTLKSYAEKTSTAELDEAYISSLIKRLSHISLGKYLNKRNQKFIASFWYADLLGAIRSLFIDSILTNVIRFSGIVVAFLSLDLYIFIPVMISVFVSLLIDFAEEKTSRKYSLQAKYAHEHKLGDIKKHLVDSFDKIVSSGGRDTTISLYHNLMHEKISFDKQRQRDTLKYSFAGSLNVTLGGFVVKLIVAYIILAGGASVGVMTMAIMYIGQIRAFFRAGFSAKSKWNTMIDELQRLDLYIKMTAAPNVTEKPLFETDGVDTLSIKDLSFAYPRVSQEELDAYQIMIKRLQSYGAKRINTMIKDKISFMQDAFEEQNKPLVPVLNGLSYVFEKGKVYGIVGYNGAGKTTLMTLLMNYFPQYEGQILYNNQDLKTISSSQCHKLFSVIMQDPFVFYFLSIRDNLLLGVDKQYTDDELLGYLAEFGLDKKVSKLRKGLDSNIGYDSDFSGGEKQLIVLIRILLQDRPILIVDEGTGQLDAQNEMLIMEKLLAKKKDKIIIFIAHRMSVMKHVDTILCMEKGSITDIGTPKELLARPSLYKSFWDYQIGS